ncbi:MAG TPA: ABC transporter substrate-binding protein [Tepidisphaeraceae bacterium]
MIQRVPRRLARATNFALVALLCVLSCGCGKSGSTGAPPAQNKSPTVASLVPAATDLLVGMGAGDHLVAVSNYDLIPQVSRLPRVGDYQAIDWEKLSVVRPNVLISFYGPGHTPAGFLEKIGQLNIQQINVKLDRLDEIYDGIIKLGAACDERAKAEAELSRLRSAIESVRARFKDQPRVPALITISPSGTDLVGQNTFFDDILQAAGGENVVGGAHPYLTLDREAISALRPRVILQLLPGRDAQTVAQARAAWNSLSDVPAVRDNRIIIWTEDYIMQPGPHLGEVAEKFAAALHPDVPSEPSTRAGS